MTDTWSLYVKYSCRRCDGLEKPSSYMSPALMVWYLDASVGVVQCKRGLGGFRISSSSIQRLGIVQFVLLHLRVQLGELLVALSSVAEVLDVEVAETQQRQRRPGLRQ